MKTILEGVVGSTAYGLNHAGSDIDKLAIHVAPVNDVLTFGLSKSQETQVSFKPDRTSHDVGKYLRLVLNGNPTVTELLWLPEYEVLAKEAWPLIQHRRAFLGADNIINAYGGYALQQINRSKKEKHLRHCFRLLLQGEELLRTGNLTVRLTDEKIAEINAAVVGEWKAFDHYDNILTKAYESTSLPRSPNTELAKEVLLRIRRANAQ